MSDVPENVKQAAAVVEQWVTAQETRRLSTEEIARLSPAERLDYARKFDQSRQPRWVDPRPSVRDWRT